MVAVQGRKVEFRLASPTRRYNVAVRLCRPQQPEGRGRNHGNGSERRTTGAATRRRAPRTGGGRTGTGAAAVAAAGDPVPAAGTGVGRRAGGDAPRLAGDH